MDQPHPPSPRPSGTARPSLGLFQALALVGATVLAYLPSLSGAFIWNDSDYVTRPDLRSAFGLDRIWFELGATQQYYPLLHSFFWVEHRLWGDHPVGYHLVTLLLHAGAALLFTRLLQRLSVPGAWFAGLIFALHPVHVESVAWITEQKNTLSIVLYLAAALAYLRFDETRRPRSYAVASLWFGLSLLCKTVTVTLPASLLVVFWWRRGRLNLRRDALPLAPWLAVGAAAGLFSSWVERHFIGAEGTPFVLPLAGRLLVAARAVWFYLGQLVWPSHLNFIYPKWTPDPSQAGQWLWPLALAVLGTGLWLMRTRTRTPLAVLLLFVGALFPVLGFVNLYGGLYSWVWDHWQYLPDLAPIALAGAGLEWVRLRLAQRVRSAGLLVAAATALPLGSLTWIHCGLFRDDETLYRGTLALNPGCWLADNNLGYLLSREPGHLDEAIADYEASVRLKPDYALAHNNLGSALMRVPGHAREALYHLRTAIQIQPDYADAHVNLGNLLIRYPSHRLEAMAEFDTALRLYPDLLQAHNSLGSAFLQMPGRLPDAISHLEAALRIDPDYAEAHNNLGIALSRSPGRLGEAIAEYQAALRFKPDFPEAHTNLGNAYLRTGSHAAEAIAEYQAALRLNPDFRPARQMLDRLTQAAPQPAPPR